MTEEERLQYCLSHNIPYHTLEQSITGSVPCEHCYGTGQVGERESCAICDGYGEVEDETNN